MGLKDTMHTMKKLLTEIHHDLEKVDGGNKAASQRVRTGSIRFAKAAKHFRKESIAAEKKMKTGAKKAAKKPAKKAAKKKKK